MTNNVETGEDLRVLLRCLSRRFEGLGADAPQIDDILLRWAGTLPDEGPEPGWQGLADQLLSALDAPSVGLAEPAPLGDEPPVSSPGELRVLLLALAADFARDRAWTQDRLAQGLWAGDGGGWASGSMAQFLESWEAWLGARLGRPPAFPGVPPIEPVTWASVAWQLGAARVYE
ncbi:hypothetical protein ACIP98_29640 [Streptomyces sp. NPDC088354]|uniref:hypothetical protein n=1 Tax=unclassified Streptomyces TaxID=2593676 RepID=UPI0029BC25CC|nr:hypothetical protein [Streptomyces sp. MI02-7b]MDX3074095.1 hypothetical protein [Streptomyces sp. MI02-7b]